MHISRDRVRVTNRPVRVSPRVIRRQNRVRLSLPDAEVMYDVTKTRRTELLWKSKEDPPIVSNPVRIPVSQRRQEEPARPLSAPAVRKSARKSQDRPASSSERRLRKTCAAYRPRRAHEE